MLLRAILAVGWIISIVCLIQLWFIKRARWWRKVCWSIALLVPYIGPLFYGALFQPLPVQAEGLRARENRDVYSGNPWDPH